MQMRLALLLSVLGYASAGTNEVGLKFLEEQKSKPGVITLPSGLMYKVLREGEGDSHPTADSPCDCFYAGTTPSLTPNAADVADDTEAINKDWNDFDSGYKRGSTTSFPPNGVIKGWTEAMQIMVEGDKWEMYIPSELGYGDGGQGGKIKGGDVLIFRMEIVTIKGGKVPAERCDIDTKKGCNEKKVKYLEKQGQATAEKRTAELKRLSGMAGGDMKEEQKSWINARINLLQKMVKKDEL